MFVSKLKAALSAVLVLGLLGTGATLLTYRAAAGQDGNKPIAETLVEPPAEQPKQEAFTAWGKEVDGLQAGLGFRPGEHRVYHHDEKVALVVRVRNVGQRNATYSYRTDLFYQNPPSVTDGGGKPVVVEGSPIVLAEIPRTTEVELPPGKEIELCELTLVVHPATDEAGAMKHAWALFGTGKFQLRYARADGVAGGGIQPVVPLGKLDTGKLELEVREPAAKKLVNRLESKTAAPVPKQDRKKNELTDWGKEVGGLQAGLGYEPLERRVHHFGETVKLVVRVRNVGKEEVSFQYLRHFFIENPPTVTDDKGKAVAFKDGSPMGIYKPLDVTLAPGKEIELYKLSLTISDEVTDTPQASTLYGEGKFQLQYERILGDTMLTSVSIKTDAALRKLATGKLDLVVRRGIDRAAAGQEEKEAFTAWGKEVGGLQAGLGFKPGEKRAYSPGETVTLVVRVRNVGKTDAKFSYFNEEYYGIPPTVADDRDRPVPLEGAGLSGLGLAKRIDVNLAPGKQVDLCEVQLALRPAGEKGNERPVWKLFGTGKFQLQYDRAGGNIRDEKTGPDPILSKLATGKLELDVNKRSFPEAMNPDFKKLLGAEVAAKAALQGTWEYVGSDEIHRWTFTDDSAINEVVYKKTNKVISKSVYGYHINPQTNPPEINFHTATDLILGIYRLKGEQLTVAYGGAWASALVRPKGFNSEDCGLDYLPLNTMGFTRVPK